MSTAATPTTTTVTYDLVMLLDPAAEEGVRTALVDDTKKAITAAGELLRHDRWGQRELAYPIDHATRAEYHLIQFHPGKVELLQDLQRTLSIADGVIRFRIVKLAPGTPEAPQGLPASSSSEESRSEHRSAMDDREGPSTDAPQSAAAEPGTAEPSDAEAEPQAVAVEAEPVEAETPDSSAEEPAAEIQASVDAAAEEAAAKSTADGPDSSAL